MKSPYAWAQTDEREWTLWKQAQHYPQLAHPIRDCGKVSGFPQSMRWMLQSLASDFQSLSSNRLTDAFVALFTSQTPSIIPDFLQSDRFLTSLRRNLVKGDTVFIPQDTTLLVWGIPEGEHLHSSVFATIDAFAEGRHFQTAQGATAGFYSVIATCSDLAQALAFPEQLWGLFLNFPDPSAFLSGAQDASQFLKIPQIQWQHLTLPETIPASVVWITYGTSLAPDIAPVNAPLSPGMFLYVAGFLGGACNQHYAPQLHYWKEQFDPDFRKTLYQQLRASDKIKDVSDGLEAICKTWLFENPQVNLSIHQESLQHCISPLFPHTRFSEMWFGGDDYSLLIASFQNFPSDAKINRIGEVIPGDGRLLFS